MKQVIQKFERLDLIGRIVGLIKNAYLVELVDTSDLKSDSFNGVSVQVR